MRNTITKIFTGFANGESITVEAKTSLIPKTNLYKLAEVREVESGKSVEYRNNQWFINEGNGKYTLYEADGLSQFVKSINNK